MQSQITLFERINATSSSTKYVNQFVDLWAMFHPDVRRYFPGDSKAKKTPPGMGAFSPAQYDGMGHKKENVTCIHFAVLDIDGQPVGTLQRIQAQFLPTASIIYSTWAHHNAASHKAGPESFRLILSLSRPVAAVEWPSFWAALNNQALGLLDPATKDQSRKYFFPASPGPDDHAFAVYSEGMPGANALDVDHMVERGARIRAGGREDAPAAVAEDPRDQIKILTKNDLLGLAHEVKKRASPPVKLVAKAIEALVNGAVYAEAGERDLMLLKVCSAVARHYRNADVSTLVELVSPGLRATCEAYKDGDLDVDREKFAEKFNRVCQDIQIEELNRLAAEEALTRADIRDAWRHKGEDRDWAYTEDEIAGFASDVGLTPEEFKRRWIIQLRSFFYVFFDGDYLTPVSQAELPTSIRRDLSPAHKAIDLFEPDAVGGRKLKAVEKIIEEYVTVARNSYADLNAQRTVYDPRRQAIIEAPCPIRKLSPVYDAHVEAWLERLFRPEDVETVLDWIATITRLDRPAVILYLTGPRGVGKTTFARGLARIWCEANPTPMAQVVANFNDALMACPLVFADESTPAEATTTWLREFQQQLERKLLRKFRDTADLKGATRIILAANNEFILHNDERLTRADIEAITERFSLVRCRVEGGEYLKTLGDHGFVSRDRIAKHALWLRDHRALPVSAEKARFFGSRMSQELAATLTVNSGATSLVCQWMHGYLRNRQAIASMKSTTEQISVRDGHLFISPTIIYEFWDSFVPHSRAPTLTRIADSVQAMTVGDIEHRHIAGGGIVPLHRIGTEFLISWATQNGVATPDEIHRQLAIPTVHALQVIRGHETPMTPEVAAAAAEQNPFGNLHTIFGVKQ